MPRLVCHVCGRQIYTVSPLEALYPEERRCPRCGTFLDPERRESDRRSFLRRETDPRVAAPPVGLLERRLANRRQGRRRRSIGSGSEQVIDNLGWID